MVVVSDSSPLIYLAKINRLGLLKQLFGKLLIPQTVFVEVVENGKQDGFSDAFAVEEAVKQKWIAVQRAAFSKNLLRIAPELGDGEAEALSLALNSKARLVLMDEAAARTVARSFGLNVRGTVFVIISAFKKKLLTRKEAKKSLKELLESGFRMAPELYAEVLEELDEPE